MIDQDEEASREIYTRPCRRKPKQELLIVSSPRILTTLQGLFLNLGGGDDELTMPKEEWKFAVPAAIVHKAQHDQGKQVTLQMSIASFRHDEHDRGLRLGFNAWVPPGNIWSSKPVCPYSTTISLSIAVKVVPDWMFRNGGNHRQPCQVQRRSTSGDGSREASREKGREKYPLQCRRSHSAKRVDWNLSKFNKYRKRYLCLNSMSKL
jgi:hypothetical protein